VVPGLKNTRLTTLVAFKDSIFSSLDKGKPLFPSSCKLFFYYLLILGELSRIRQISEGCGIKVGEDNELVMSFQNDRKAEFLQGTDD
jgi:hypothetical protein